MQTLLVMGWATLVSATAFTVTVYAPDTEIHGTLLNAAAQGFYAGISAPATYCPSVVTTGCPPVEGTLVSVGMEAMAVRPPLPICASSS
jgi:hypothetical protein